MGRGDFNAAHQHLAAASAALAEPSAAPYHACVAAELAWWERWLSTVEPFVLPAANHLMHAQNPTGLAEELARFFG